MKAKLLPTFLCLMLAMPAWADTTLERNIEQENKNIELVTTFYDEFFNKHNTTIAEQYIAPSYKQHNPYVPDGLEPFVSYFANYFMQNTESRAVVHRVASHGDLVFLHVESRASNKEAQGEAVVDIFRVENGMIVEHWDVIQHIPEESANPNTMF